MSRNKFPLHVSCCYMCSVARCMRAVRTATQFAGTLCHKGNDGLQPAFGPQLSGKRLLVEVTRPTLRVPAQKTLTFLRFGLIPYCSTRLGSKIVLSKDLNDMLVRRCIIMHGVSHLQTFCMIIQEDGRAIARRFNLLPAVFAPDRCRCLWGLCCPGIPCDCAQRSLASGIAHDRRYTLGLCCPGRLCDCTQCHTRWEWRGRLCRCWPCGDGRTAEDVWSLALGGEAAHGLKDRRRVTINTSRPVDNNRCAQTIVCQN